MAMSLLAQTSPTSSLVEFEQVGQNIKGFVRDGSRREDGIERRIDIGLPGKSVAGRLMGKLWTFIVGDDEP
jgi:hypothetical protein